jgi:hypothetical protein
MSAVDSLLKNSALNLITKLANSLSTTMVKISSRRRVMNFDSFPAKVPSFSRPPEKMPSARSISKGKSNFIVVDPLSSITSILFPDLFHQSHFLSTPSGLHPDMNCSYGIDAFESMVVPLVVGDEVGLWRFSLSSASGDLDAWMPRHISPSLFDSTTDDIPFPAFRFRSCLGVAGAWGGLMLHFDSWRFHGRLAFESFTYPCDVYICLSSTHSSQKRT